MKKEDAWVSEVEEKEGMPKSEDLLIPLEDLLAAGLHIGTRIKTGDMQAYIYRPTGRFVHPQHREDR